MTGGQPSGRREAALPPGPRADELPLDSLALVVLDGWGLAPTGPGNAVSLADTPRFDELWESYPHTTLDTSGRSVGLPDGQMGNSEVGHLNLGAGAIVKQDLVRIDDAIADGSFFRNDALRGACAAAREGGRLHLLGLVSDGGVHSSLDHLRACIELAVREQVPELVLHAFTDGRDTSPTSSPDLSGRGRRLAPGGAAEAGTRARVGSVSGRYWAMDRDRRWDRTRRAYDAIVHGEGLRAPTADAAVKQAYGRDETDEFIQPTVIAPAEPESQDPRTLVRSGDTVLTFNFRPDRMRQLVSALGEDAFDEFDRGETPRVRVTTMTRYREDWAYPVAFEPSKPEVTVAQAAGRPRRAPASRRRDREVPARDLLLQRRRGGAAGGRGALPGSLAARRSHLRPQAGDERSRGRDGVRRALAGGGRRG